MHNSFHTYRTIVFILLTQKVNELVFKASIIGVINRLSHTNTIRFSQSDRVSAENDDIVNDAGYKARQRKTSSSLLLCIVSAANSCDYNMTGTESRVSNETWVAISLNVNALLNQTVRDGPDKMNE